MSINPDKDIIFYISGTGINKTIVCTWFVMALLIGTAYFLGRKLQREDEMKWWQGILESIYEFGTGQIKEIMRQDGYVYFPFLVTLLLFVFTANILEVLPLYHPPTSSLSTTMALAVLVFLSVAWFGIKKKGVIGYLKSFAEPSIIMVPFNIISDISRTLAMGIRLFGNIMSESLIGAVLISIVPFFIPILMQLFGIIVGTIQAYIFFVLSAVFIGAAVTVEE